MSTTTESTQRIEMILQVLNDHGFSATANNTNDFIEIGDWPTSDFVIVGEFESADKDHSTWRVMNVMDLHDPLTAQHLNEDLREIEKLLRDAGFSVDIEEI